MSDFSDAFRELREEVDRSTGKKGEVVINGKKFPAIIENVIFSDEIAKDGTGEAGGFTALVAIDDYPKKPSQGDDIEAEGMALTILSVELVRGSFWNITAGDPANE